MSDPVACPCQSGHPYDQCCGVFLETAAVAKTPEQLMRSRYTAFTQANGDYLDETVAGKAHEKFDKAEAVGWAKGLDWQGLQVLDSLEQGNEGFVEFIAQYKVQGVLQKMHERSRFQRIDGRWFYVSSVKPKCLASKQTVGRNDPCPCGSGKKFKKCCL